MNSLRSEHIDHIEYQIAQSGIEDESLRIDLTDHMCCLVEEKLEMGNSYDAAYQEVMEIFKTSRLTAIKQETELLTKSNFIMKKRTVIIGIVAILTILVGSVLKANHMVGANITLLIGFAMLAFGFVLFNLLDRFKYINEGDAKLWHLAGHSGLIVFIIGVSLKVLHLPGANITLMLGAIVLAISFMMISSSKYLLKS